MLSAMFTRQYTVYSSHSKETYHSGQVLGDSEGDCGSLIFFSL